MLLWQDFPLQWGYARTIRKRGRAPGTRCGRPARPPSVDRAVVRAQRTDRAEPRSTATARASRPCKYVAGQQLPSWNKTVLDRWVKRAFEQADETRTDVAHSGVLPHLPLLDGTDSHLYFGWYHGDERDLAAASPRRCRGWCASSASSAPRPCRRPPTSSNRIAGPTSTGNGCSSTTVCSCDASTSFVPPADYATFDEWRDGDAAYQAECSDTTSRRCAG